jgi:hypothetical protein
LESPRPKNRDATNLFQLSRKVVKALVEATMARRYWGLWQSAVCRCATGNLRSTTAYIIAAFTHDDDLPAPDCPPDSCPGPSPAHSHMVDKGKRSSTCRDLKVDSHWKPCDVAIQRLVFGLCTMLALLRKMEHFYIFAVGLEEGTYVAGCSVRYGLRPCEVPILRVLCISIAMEVTCNGLSLAQR